MTSGCSDCTGQDSNSAGGGAKITIAKGVVAAASLYVLYIGVTCPCKPQLYSCHLSELYVALAVIVAVLFYFNGLRVLSYNKHMRPT